MLKDRRKKGCPNLDCERYKGKYLYKSTDQFCTICGQPLVYVCKDCFTKIEDTDYKHIKCVNCQATADDNKARVADVGKKALGMAVGAAAAIGAVAQNEFVKQGGRIATKVVKEGFNKVIKK